MHLKEITVSELDELYIHMERDFPKNEIIPFFLLKLNIRRKNLLAFYLVDNNTLCAYAIVAPIPPYKCLDIEYLAVIPAMRRKGYGSKMLTILSQRLAFPKLTLQVEDPAFAENPQEKRLREKRIQFYKENGFSILPKWRLRLFGVPMLCLSNWKATPVEIKNIMAFYFNRAYTRIPTLLGVKFEPIEGKKK